MKETIEYIVGELQKLELKPGDVFVLHSDNPLSSDMVQRLRLSWDEMMPGHRIIILDKGLRLGVVSTFFEEEKKE